MVRLVLLLPMLLLLACQTSVRRGAVVPHNTPIARTGQAMNSAAEASLGFSTIAPFGAPSDGSRGEAGVAIPSQQFDGALRALIGENADIGLLWETGLGQGANRLANDYPVPEDEDVYGGGASFFYSMQTGTPGLRIGLSTQMVLFSVPYVEYETCIEPCNNLTFTERGRDTEPVIGFGIHPSLKQGDFTYFGGVSAKNHLTIDKGDIELVGTDSGDVEFGSYNLTMTAGAEWSFQDRVRVMLYAYQDLSTAPAVYRPTLGFALTLPFGRQRPTAFIPLE